jgi:hypothetical protein
VATVNPTRPATAALAAALFCGVFLPVMTVNADEGMWLLNDPPRKHLKDKYQFDLTDDWLTHAQKASVRFNNGGSGGFVSADGLVATNHHIGADSVQKVSPRDRDYLRGGFYARTRDEELRCPDLELNVLQSITDVTGRVSAAVKAGMKPAEAFAARRAVMAEIEKQSLEQTRQRSDVVTLYQGGLYHLYRYKKYTDVRLVFAPEADIAAFGGDVDNFEYPRHGLDFCFFRVYEGGKPAKVEHFFRWSETGPKEGDLVFVTGHPGTTNRLETLAKLKHRRDVTLPYNLARLRALEAALSQFSEGGPDRARMAATDLHRVANARKAQSGQYQGLLDPKILGQKADAEKQFRLTTRLAQPQMDIPPPDEVGMAFDRVAEIQQTLAPFERDYSLLERDDAFYHGFFSELFTIALHLVRMSVELKKPNADRLREYRESNLESLRFRVFSPAPIHAELERARLTASLTFLAEQRGGGDSLVEKVLAGKNPANRAAELVAGTKLADPAERRKLADGGVEAIESSQDTMIRLARLVDDEARRLRKRYEEQVEEPERQAYAKLAEGRFKTYGRGIAPDATFTLRLAFGVVKGYEVDGEKLPFQTTFGSAFERADKQGHRPPFEMPKRWRDGKAKLDPATPFNFVSTADTIGGNSGSPVLNRAGELVGLNFDRNRHGLVRNFVYTEEQARHIAVHSRGILEALRRLYDAEPLVRELTRAGN